MKCQLCGKKASVHLTEIIDGQMSELHLCDECAHQKSTPLFQQFGISDLISGLASFGKSAKTSQEVELICPNCGISYEKFIQMGRFGCSQCYTAFRERVGPLLRKIHGSDRHLGKSPRRGAKKTQDDDILFLEDLRERLHQAILLEKYEEAAELRDKIHDLEKKRKKK